MSSGNSENKTNEIKTNEKANKNKTNEKNNENKTNENKTKTNENKTDYWECKKCGEKYSNVSYAHIRWCKSCQINYSKGTFANWTSGNEKIDNLIREMQLKINKPSKIFEWVKYDQFDDIKEISKGDFATICSAIWKDGSLYYYDKKYRRSQNTRVILKYLHNSQNVTDEFINEVKAYATEALYDSNILHMYGISQNTETKDYIMILQFARGGNFINWLKKNYISFSWKSKLYILSYIIGSLKNIHQRQMIHRNFHIGNILFKISHADTANIIYISDVGLCGQAGNKDKSKIYGVMPYVAPEVLKGKPYTQAADIYSFGMIMYYVATGRQPFANCAHNQHLALNIYNGIRPEINDLEAPKWYVDLMRKCWSSNPNDRPSSVELNNLIFSFIDVSLYGSSNNEINKQFKSAEEYRKTNLNHLSDSQSATHPQAIYTSRLLNPFINILPKYENIYSIL